jgi:hypothetical protein
LFIVGVRFAILVFPKRFVCLTGLSPARIKRKMCLLFTNGKQNFRTCAEYGEVWAGKLQSHTQLKKYR